ncbi:hypothetical protein [Algoriphagus jejuensis]
MSNCLLPYAATTNSNALPSDSCRLFQANTVLGYYSETDELVARERV